MPFRDRYSSMDFCFLLDGSAVCHQILNEIGDTLDKVLHIEDVEASDISINADAGGNLKVDPHKCLNERATFLLSGGTKLLHSSSLQEDEMPELALPQLVSEEHASDVLTRSNSLPPALKPPSAMKGSREKRGASTGKLTVTWAPDVYDPPPTSISHFLSRGSKQRMAKKDKKNGKKGHKGKDSSKTGDSKKRKQYCRTSMSSTNRRCYPPTYDYPRCDFGIPLGGTRLEIGSKETCGSSYFMNPKARVHYSAAEAL